MELTTAQRLLQEEQAEQMESPAESRELQSLKALRSAKKNAMVLRLDQIIRNPQNRQINMEKVAELKESIKCIGLLHDISVKPVGNGTYMIISGEHRYEAYVQLAKEDEQYNYIPVKKFDSDDLHAELALIDGNLKSNGLSPYEEVIAIGRRAEIMKKLGVKGVLRDVIAKEVGGGATQVGKKLRIYKKACPEVLSALQNDQITIEKAAEIANVDPESQKILLQEKDTTKTKPRKQTCQEQQGQKEYEYLLQKTFKVLEQLSEYYYDHPEFQHETLCRLLGNTNQIKRQIRVCLFELKSKAHVID